MWARKKSFFLIMRNTSRMNRAWHAIIMLTPLPNYDNPSLAPAPLYIRAPSASALHTHTHTFCIHMLFVYLHIFFLEFMHTYCAVCIVWNACETRLGARCSVVRTLHMLIEWKNGAWLRFNLISKYFPLKCIYYYFSFWLTIHSRFVWVCDVMFVCVRARARARAFTIHFWTCA